MTFVFNTFVMLQVFNFLNSRKIHDEVILSLKQINIFAGLTQNSMFIVIVFIIFILQATLVSLAGSAFGVYSYYGLHPLHWAISVTLPLFRLASGPFRC